MEPDTERYTVKRGDSLWKIAEERLGDGTRYVELVDLNQAVLDGRPDFLLPGTVLKVPVVEAPPEGAYVVQPGDTLSEIAEEELGDADAYPSIFEASRDTVQANGAHLTDPDLILPGWKLTIPGHASPKRPPKHPSTRAHPSTRDTRAPRRSHPSRSHLPRPPRNRPCLRSRMQTTSMTRPPRRGCCQVSLAQALYSRGASGWCCGSTVAPSCATAGPERSSLRHHTNSSRSRRALTSWGR